MMQTETEAAHRPQAVEGLALRSTRYDRVCVALTSAIGLLGAVTLLMLLVWLSRTTVWDRPPVRASMGGNTPSERANAPPEPTIPDFQPPGEQELAAGSEPLPEPVLESIALVVQSQMVTLEALSQSDGAGSRGKRGTGGDGPLEEGPLIGTIDPGGRWEVRLSASNLEEYKRQLDYFGIELGVAGGGIKTVDYAKGFASARPTIRLAQDPKKEKRLRFLYRDGPLKQADRELARAAGIEIEGRIVFQFYSDEMYQTLLKLENDRMKPRYISEVVRTVFGVKIVDDRYAFYVIRQDYRSRAAPLPLDESI